MSPPVNFEEPDVYGDRGFRRRNGDAGGRPFRLQRASGRFGNLGATRGPGRVSVRNTAPRHSVIPDIRSSRLTFITRVASLTASVTSAASVSGSSGSITVGSIDIARSTFS